METKKNWIFHINLKLILTLLKTFASIVITDDDNKSHQTHKINTYTLIHCANIIKEYNAVEMYYKKGSF